MEKELERNVQHRHNRKQQWSVYVGIYVFKPDLKCLQLIRLSPFSHSPLREHLTSSIC